MPNHSLSLINLKPKKFLTPDYFFKKSVYKRPKAAISKNLTVSLWLIWNKSKPAKSRIWSTSGSFGRPTKPKLMTKFFLTPAPPGARNWGDLLLTSLKRQKSFFGPAANTVGGPKKFFYIFRYVYRCFNFWAKKILKFFLKFRSYDQKTGIFEPSLKNHRKFSTRTIFVLRVSFSRKNMKFW